MTSVAGARRSTRPEWSTRRRARPVPCGSARPGTRRESRAHGSNGARQLIPHYACLDNRRRGKAICANPVALRQDILDRKILGAITEVLQPEVLERAVDKALAA